MMSDEELEQLLAPSHQPYTGPLYDADPVSRELAITGQENPIDERRLSAQHGRFLSGVGAMPEKRQESVVERAEFSEVYDLEQQDDVLGSGVFDPYHRSGTSNTNTGVFASQYSLPGYAAREVPFTVNRDITDLTDDASVVSVPGGGMAYVESRGRLVGPSCAGGMPPPPPGLHPAPATSRDQTYVDLTPAPPRGWDADSLLRSVERQPCTRPLYLPTAEMAPQWSLYDQSGGGALPPDSSTSWDPPTHVRPRGRAHPGHLPTPTTALAPIASSKRSSFGDPAFPSVPGAPCNYASLQPPREPMWSVRGVPTSPRYSAVPRSPSERRVPTRATFEAPYGRPGLALGQDGQKSDYGWLAFLGAGVVAGVAIRMLVGTMKGAPSR